MNTEKRIEVSLLLLRVGVFVVMFMWTIDKLISPNHMASVFERYYQISGVSNGFSYFIGIVQLLVVLGFLLGFKKRFTYGAILVMHTISTLSSWKMYIDPWGPKNLLFFAAWPMLAALVSLYLLRDCDTLFTIGRRKKAGLESNRLNEKFQRA